MLMDYEATMAEMEAAGPDRSVLWLADLARASAAEAAGLRCRLAVDGDSALDMLNGEFDVGAAVVALARATPALVDALLQEDAPPVVALVGETDDDAVAAARLLDAAEAQLLPADVKAATLVAATARALATTKLAVADAPLSTAERDRLKAYFPQVDRTEPAISEESACALIRATLKARRLRERFFEPTLFADPAWDMLLDLAAARIERKEVSVSSLCIAASVPTTTALRWIKTLCDSGAFTRRLDPDDRRRVLIALSKDAFDTMLRYLAGANRVQALVV